MSRLLQRLADQLATERDEYVRGELIALQAAYLARVGDFAAARERIATVRATFFDGRSGRVTALVMIAEALLAHFESLSPGARDRAMRAQLLGDVMRDPQIIALSSAWRAHIEFEFSSFDVAALALKKALAVINDRDHSAWSRCCIVLFNALSFVGDRERAQAWFLRGHQHAVADGDQASIDALLQSKASYNVAQAWVGRCLSKDSEKLLQVARAEVASARNLQLLVRVQAHEDYIELAECNLCLLEGRYSDALEWLTKLEGSGPFPAGHFTDSVGQVMSAYCQLKLGRLDSAVATFDNVRDASWGDIDVDDRLIVCWMMRELARASPRFLSLALAEAAFQQATEEYQVEVARVSKVFSDFAVEAT
jgi:tetratricopeptide (TPR) repeat protein